MPQDPSGLTLDNPSAQDPLVAALAQVRVRLEPAQRRDQPLQTLAAAAFFCIAAMTFAASAILAPANVTTPAARASVK